MTIGNRPPTVRADGRGPRDLRPVSFELGVQKWAEGSCRDPVRRHGGAVRGDDRRPRPAAPARQGHRLGDRRVLDAAAGDRRAHATASRPRAGSAAGPTRSSGSSGARCAASSTSPGSASGRSPSTATSSRPTAGRAPRRSPAATSRSPRRSSRTAWSATSSARSRRCRSGIVNGAPLLDLDYSEDSHAEVDFNVVGTDAGTYVELQGTAEGKPFDRAGANAMLDLADEGLAQPVRRPRPRSSPRSGGDRATRPRLARRHALRAQAARAARAAPARARRAGLARRPRHHRRPGRGRRDVRGQRRDQGPLRRAGSGLPTLADDSGLEVDALGGGPGVRTRRYAGETRHRCRQQRASCSRALDGLPPERRGARYVCVLALALPDGRARAAALPLSLRARHVPRPDRDRAARDGRVRLRPDLRAGVASRPAAGRSGLWTPGREARDLASRPGGPADGADPRRARVLRRRDGGSPPDLRLLRREPGPRPGLRRAAPGGRDGLAGARHRRRLRRRPGRADGRPRRCGAGRRRRGHRGHPAAASSIASWPTRG